MIIGIMSDTHDNLPMTKKAVKLLVDKGAEMFMHCGDYVAPFTLKPIVNSTIPFVGVFGNNDGEKKGLINLGYELYKGPHRVSVDDVSIVMAHDPVMLERALGESDDVGLCGHTHRPDITKDSHLVVNPGEVCGWLTGRCSVALLDTNSLHAEIVDLGIQDRG